MSEFDKHKEIRRRRYYSSQRDRGEIFSGSSQQRRIYKYECNNSDFDRVQMLSTAEQKERQKDVMPTQPTILLKNREQQQQTDTTSVVNNSSNIYKEMPEQIHKSKVPSVDLSSSLWCPPKMTKSVQLIDENFQFVDDNNMIQEYLMDNSCDFLVVGIIGGEGVGKSTIMNLLVDNKQADDDNSLLNKYFQVQTENNLELGLHCTNGLNIYVTPNRTILLDSQPILSVSCLDKMIQLGSAATAAGEVVLTENSSEIQSLQLASFLLTVCHLVIVVQDWFFDPNIIRFIQTAEMLKPSLTSAGGEEELNEHSPHLLLLHNKAKMHDFNPPQFKIMQQTYRTLFGTSKLKIESGLGIAKGNIHHSLCPETCGDPLNIYLIPHINDLKQFSNDDDKNELFRGYPKLTELIGNLKAQIQSVTRNQLLTHSTQLSERGWLHYAQKAWDGVKKSSFFVEYNKLLP